jgi:UDP-N-acetylmuramoylalanine--D-glutamate ligase
VAPQIDLRNKRVLVVGVARTGVATALFCASRGACVTTSDARSEALLGEAAAQLRHVNCAMETGGHSLPVFQEQDLIVPSPGVPADLPALAAARRAGIPVWSEIELASRFLRGTLVAITGSNGKTTTTALLGHILAGAGKKVVVAGNIGTPLISRVDDSSDESVTVAEISSFQLEWIETFRPHISVVLNITPDHLDRHRSFEDYCRVKLRILENQGERDYAVLNADDAVLLRQAPRSRVCWFSRIHDVPHGAAVSGGELVFRDERGETVLLELADIRLRGEHNLENVLAAASAAWLLGTPAPAIAEGVRSFPGVEHRIEFVADIGGVQYFNDSKATNVDAALKAIGAFPSRLFVILGGKDKDSDYTALTESLKKHAKLVLLIGAAADKIETQLGDSVSTVRSGTLDRALATAVERAVTGDTVLLAPACASFDQFDNYEHRGRVFKELVRAWASVHASLPKTAADQTRSRISSKG